MTKEEIKKMIIDFKSDKDILEFIQSRILELEKDVLSDKIGFRYKTINNNYISAKTMYIVGHSFFDEDFPSLVFDDITPYFNLLKELSTSKEYTNELYLFTPVMFEIFNYLSSSENKQNAELTARKRDKLYLDKLRNKETQISIKMFHQEKLGLCGENAGLAHNFFKIIGIDSQLVIGKRNNDEHAFNIIFPKGYGSSPAVLFDPSYMVNFTNNIGNKYSLGYFKVLTSEEYSKMLSGESTAINLENSVNNLIKYYPMLSNCTVSYENATYSIGSASTLKIDNESNVSNMKKG